MNEGFHIAQAPQPSARNNQKEGFNYRDTTGEWRVDDGPRISINEAKVAQTLATHDGLIRGIQSSLSSIQSSVTSAQTSFGAWLTAVALATAAVTGILIFNVTRTNSVGDRVDGVHQRIGSLESRSASMEGRIAGVEASAIRLEDKIDLLPERIALASKAATPASQPK